jgi:hypothetical protein
MQIQSVIATCIQAMGLSPREITERFSGEFALSVLEMLGVELGERDPNCRLLFTEDLTDEALPRHAWGFFHAKHYDAECPQGVNDWKELPVFRRARMR